MSNTFNTRIHRASTFFVLYLTPGIFYINARNVHSINCIIWRNFLIATWSKNKYKLFMRNYTIRQAVLFKTPYTLYCLFGIRTWVSVSIDEETICLKLHIEIWSPYSECQRLTIVVADTRITWTNLPHDSKNFKVSCCVLTRITHLYC